MSTRNEPQRRAPGASWRQAQAGAIAGDPAEIVAAVAQARRDLLLRVHSFRLRREDLEDCYSQATYELIVHARRGGKFASRVHIANIVEQRFLSRVHDRRRALAGRSPMQATLESAMSIDDALEQQIEIVDQRADVARLAIHRDELRRVLELAAALSPDQRLLIACEVGLQMRRPEFCERYGWSAEKYRKVGQRARARLRRLVALDDERVPPPAAPSEGNTEPAHENSPPPHRHVPQPRRRSVEHTTAR